MNDDFTFFLFEFLDKLRRVLRNKKVNLYFHGLVIKWLENKYGFIIKKYSNCSHTIDNGTSERIWVMWWQGMDKAPTIVKTCLNQLESEFENITVITKKNYDKYVHINPFIIEKMENGIIGMACFSDIMRANLLYTHGGVWVDSTCFVKSFNKNNLALNKIYTPKGKDFFNAKYVPEGKWRGFFLKTNKGNLTMKFLSEMFDEYWFSENKMINFFLIDYFLEIAYLHNIDGFKEEIDSLGFDNTGLYDLDKFLQKKNEYEFKWNPNTSIYKLNWKHRYYKLKKRIGF